MAKYKMYNALWKTHNKKCIINHHTTATPRLWRSAARHACHCQLCAVSTFEWFVAFAWLLNDSFCRASAALSIISARCFSKSASRDGCGTLGEGSLKRGSHIVFVTMTHLLPYFPDSAEPASFCGSGAPWCSACCLCIQPGGWHLAKAFPSRIMGYSLMLPICRGPPAMRQDVRAWQQKWYGVSGSLS